MKNKYKYLIFIIILEIILSSVIFLKFNDVAYNGDALYEAQVARNVLAGKGYVTSEMPLYAIDLYKQKGMSLEAPWINTHKFILPVYIKAFFLKIFGDNLTSATFLYSYFFHFLSLILIYFLGLKIWPEKPVLAFLTSFLFLVNPILGFGTPYIMISGLNLVVDTFIFLLLLFVIYFWKENESNWLLLLAGFISGIAFLDRYNSGLYIVAIFVFMAYLLILKRYNERPLKNLIIQFIKKYAIYFSGFIVVIIGLIIWNLKSIGQPFMSINGLFQLLFNTPYNSFIDPWYKLEYIFPTNNPFWFALKHPAVLIAKSFKAAFLDIVRFISFEGVLWWTPLVFGYFFISRKQNKQDKSLRTIDFILVFTIILTVLQLIILSLWGGGIAYFFYLFPVFIFAIVYFLNFIYQSMVDLSFLKNEKFINIFKKASEQIVEKGISNTIIFTLLFISLILLVLPISFGVFKFLSIHSYLIIAFALFLLHLIGFTYLKRYKLLPIFFVVLGLIYFIVQTGILTGIFSKEEFFRSRWDLEGYPQNIKDIKKINKNGVVISMTPWNIVWWSNNQLNALPLPEYPDEIYLLEKKYNQKIDAIYLDKIIKYPFKYIPYYWTAYQRAIKFGYSFEGFNIFKRLPEGIILERDPAFLPDLTKTIDFGKESANSHLVWGWGENVSDGQRDYVSAVKYNYLTQTKEIFQGTKTDEKKVKKEDDEKQVFDIMIKSGDAKYYYKSDAEVSFLTDSASGPKKIEIMIKSLVENQTMKVILNGNLLYAGQEGIDLGDFKIKTDWQKIILDVNPKHLHDGINKLSFIFSSTYTEYKILQDKVVPGEKFALFDYIKLDNN